MKGARAILILALVVRAGAARAAGDLPINAFAGHFVGSGLARNALSEYFALTSRDLDVRIEPAGEGFTLTWTTVLRQGGNPDAPDVRRKTASLRFVPSGRGDIFRAEGSGDPLRGTPLTWARIRGQTLTVHMLHVDDDGSYTVLSWERTLTGNGMSLRFTRVRDGESLRSVTGDLVKAGN